MTDAALVDKKLAQIETYVAELRRLARVDEIGRDVREERFVEHTLQLAIQAALDVASHIVSDERLGEPATNRDLFDLLRRRGYLTESLALTLIWPASGTCSSTGTTRWTWRSSATCSRIGSTTCWRSSARFER
jgi:hypothetical protein